MSKLPIAALALAITASIGQAAPVQWAGNGHWYEVAQGGGTWITALGLASGKTHLGLSGHLATITSAAEQAFVSGLVGTLVGAYLGGSDAAEEGTWRWVTGPEAGSAFTYTNWAPGEPTNALGEDYLVGWLFYPQWDNLFGDVNVANYVVEYSTVAPAPVPLPAAMGLLLVGLGALGATRMSRRG